MDRDLGLSGVRGERERGQESGGPVRKRDAGSALKGFDAGGLASWPRHAAQRGEGLRRLLIQVSPLYPSVGLTVFKASLGQPKAFSPPCPGRGAA